MRHRYLPRAAVALALTAAVCAPAATAHAANPPAGRTENLSVRSAESGPALPAPTGKHPVGKTTLHLKDDGRPDPWVPGERRELMVSVWYPAVRPSKNPAPYMTAAESEEYLKTSGVKVPPHLLSTVRTHATLETEPAARRGGLPLVVLSPGFGMPRATLTGLAEELASRGYAVAAVGHNYEANGTTFPDGHTTPCAACKGADMTDADWQRVGAVRAQDISFVLDELTSDRPGWQGRKFIDAGRIAMVGHSAGGFSIIPAMLRDARIKAGVNMDGNFRYPNDVPLDRPVLMLGMTGHVPGGPDATWDRTWKQFTGWKRWLSVEGTGHLSFTDLAALTKKLGIPFQDLDGDRCDAVTRAYVAAFVDRHLRGTESALLTGPSARYPEVVFHRP
ncbi:alpha/beta fold hydrolase [Streptomyces sp. NPDC052496]|uniref:alpha/beta hydrolase family protein n=1 Tax=Streptomyces sp. NPDC052496 TaxID=3154951 RepID=UPI00341B1FD4